jgi:hypothetical protein
MTVTGEMWGKHLNMTEGWNVASQVMDHELSYQPTIVFTTEATSMIKEQREYVAANQTDSRYPQYNFQYMTNHHDVTPDSGFIRYVGTSGFFVLVYNPAFILSVLSPSLLPWLLLKM